MAHDWKITSFFDFINLFQPMTLVFGAAVAVFVSVVFVVVVVVVVQKLMTHFSRSDIPRACWGSRPCGMRSSCSWCTYVCNTGMQNFWGKSCKSYFRQCWRCCLHMFRRPLLKKLKRKKETMLVTNHKNWILFSKTYFPVLWN